MKTILILSFVITIAVKPLYSQSFSLNDSTVSFKNPDGKMLTREEARQLMKEKFSIRQEQVNGKKVITIYPQYQDEQAMFRAKTEAWRNSLLDKPVAGFKLKDLNEKQWNAKDLKGKIVVMNFWFTACKPCILEMPDLNELVKNNKDKPVVFLAPAPENDAQVKKFLKKYSFDYKIIPSSLEFITQLSVENFPTHLIIDKEGMVRQVFIGYANDIQKKIQTEIDLLLAK
jgi:peroxiredoxin